MDSGIGFETKSYCSGFYKFPETLSTIYLFIYLFILKFILKFTHMLSTLILLLSSPINSIT